MDAMKVDSTNLIISIESLTRVCTQNQARVGSDPRNIEQADSEVLLEQVQRITGHTPDADYVLKGQISHRETVPISHGMTFDVYRGKLNDGETVAIKILRQKLNNDGDGVRFVEVLILFPD
jgi:hypothetical protein